MKLAFSLIAMVAAIPAFAESSRQLDAHEHGVGALNIAIDGETVEMEFHAPGADIVGFEYEAESDADLAAIDAAISKLEAPLDLFVLSGDAACALTGAVAELEEEGAHDEEDDHKEDGHDDHANEEHTDEEHDAHKDEEHADDDHGHEDHADEAGHTEFHAEYSFACENPDALTEITFAYFETFPNALEVEVRLVTSSGAKAFEVERDAPVLKLER